MENWEYVTYIYIGKSNEKIKAHKNEGFCLSKKEIIELNVLKL